MMLYEQVPYSRIWPSVGRQVLGAVTVFVCLSSDEATIRISSDFANLSFSTSSAFATAVKLNQYKNLLTWKGCSVCASIYTYIDTRCLERAAHGVQRQTNESRGREWTYVIAVCACVNEPVYTSIRTSYSSRKGDPTFGDEQKGKYFDFTKKKISATKGVKVILILPPYCGMCECFTTYNMKVILIVKFLDYRYKTTSFVWSVRNVFLR